MERERSRWLFQTPIGLIFQLGVLISLLVGAAIVYMVLATDVANRLPEYATLLAMGYSRKYLASIVMTQAITLCCCGFLVAWGAAELLYRMTSYLSGIPVAMNPERVISVLAMGLANVLLQRTAGSAKTLESRTCKSVLVLRHNLTFGLYFGFVCHWLALPNGDLPLGNARPVYRSG